MHTPQCYHQLQGIQNRKTDQAQWITEPVTVPITSLALTVEADCCEIWRLCCFSLKVLPVALRQLQEMRILERLVEDKALKRPL